MRTIERDIVGAFIFSADNKVLLGHSGVFQGRWCVPGGGIEVGETKLQAVIRETREETGIDISAAEISWFDDVSEGKSEKTLRGSGERVFVEMKFYDYVVKLSQSSGDIAVQSADDFTDARWFSREELTGLELAPATRARLIEQEYIREQ